MRDYEILPEVTLGGFHVIEITSGSFAGVKFYFSRVAFAEGDDGVPILQFTYTLVDGEVQPEKEAALKQRLGDILVDVMAAQVIRNEVIYTGGT
jgi:hypothetical protein